VNSNWRNRPTTIDFIDRNRIDAIINIDESGSANLKQVVKAKHAGTPPADSEKHFTVTACVISMADFAEARDMVMALKNKYWTDGLYSYKGIQKRVCFHSREIRGRKDAFNPDIIDYKSFVADLSQLMAAIPMCIYASHIDKERHVNQYIHPIEPYDLCMTFVLERILRDLPVNQNCVIILESRGAKEDRAVLDFIKGLIDNGTRFHPASHFSRIKGVYFNPKWCKAADDRMSYWELELADLCAYPIQKFFVYGTMDLAFQVILPKLSHYPDHMGKGLKSFPIT
jgi:hypothetical protein